jgi:hypothetical protein
MWGVVGAKSLHWAIFFKELRFNSPTKKISTKLIIMFVEVKCVQKLIPNIQILSLTFVVSPSLKTSKSISTK